MAPHRNIGRIAIVVAAALMLAGCDDTEDEQRASIPSVPTAPQPTAPITTQAGTTPSPKAAPEPTPAAPTSDPNACVTSEAISPLKFQGVPCEEAATVADAWDRDQDRCNTVDDPNSPEGYNRICEVEGYTCRAKRDVKSDARFVACARGAAKVRFTWAPP